MLKNLSVNTTNFIISQILVSVKKGGKYLKLTIQQAVTIFFDESVSKELLYKAVRLKHIPHVRLGDNKIIFDSEDLERWWKSESEKSIQKQECKGLRKVAI